MSVKYLYWTEPNPKVGVAHYSCVLIRLKNLISIFKHLILSSVKYVSKIGRTDYAVLEKTQFCSACQLVHTEFSSQKRLRDKYLLRLFKARKLT